MSWYLVVAGGVHNGMVIPVLSQFLIGRDQPCQLRPTSAQVSRRHCAIWVQENRAFVRDLGSANGTLLNGQKLSGARELQDGDRLHVGPLHFVVLHQAAVPVDQRTDIPASGQPTDEDAAAAILLQTSDEECLGMNEDLLLSTPTALAPQATSKILEEITASQVSATHGTAARDPHRLVESARATLARYRETPNPRAIARVRPKDKQE